VLLAPGRVGSLKEGEAKVAACAWGREIRGCMRMETAEEKPSLAPGREEVSCFYQRRGVGEDLGMRGGVQQSRRRSCTHGRCGREGEP
jgi:hypothetical protein